MSKEAVKKTIDLSSQLFCCNESRIAKGNNFLFKNGEIISRKGINTNESRKLFQFSGKAYATVIPTDTYIFYKGKRANILIVREWEDIEDIYKVYKFKLLFADGTVKDIGSIDFSGHSPGTSAEPTSYIIYQGKNVRGGGLFFIVNKYYEKTHTNVVGIYEISEDFSYWIPLENEDMYAPIVFFNGQGESNYIAKFNDPNINLPTPEFLESKNLLTGAFKSYFTTDGYSFAFSLPYDNLTGEAITCGYNLNAETYLEWTVNEGHPVSANEVEIEGTKVVLRCDREKGRMVFTTPSGELFHLPKTNSVNNLWFKAYKSNQNDALKVASMSIAKAFAGKSNYSAMTVAGGSAISPCEILWIDGNNPLYFPDSCKTNLGENKEEIQAFCMMDGNLFVFSKTKLFKGKFIAEKGYNLKGILAGVKGSGSIKESSVSFDLVGLLPDEAVPETIKEIKGKIFFCGKNGGVYCFGEKANNFTQISPVASFENCKFALLDSDDYLVFTEDSAFVLTETQDLKNSLFYKQKYPVKILGGANVDSSAICFGSTLSEYAPFLYTFSLDGEKDLFFTEKEGDFVFAEDEIQSVLELKLQKQSFSENRLIRFKADAKSRNTAHVVFKNREIPFYANTLPGTSCGIDVCGGGVFEELKVVIKFLGAFSLKGLCYYYRKLRK